MTDTASILILYGTTTGNSEMVADELAEIFDRKGIPYRLSKTDEIDPEILYEVNTLLLLMSTDGDGDPPLMAEDFYSYLNNKSRADLHDLSYSVLALGDSYYDNFCQAGKDLDHMLEELGARRIVDRVDCDEHYWEDAEGWIENVCSVTEQKEHKPVLSVQS